jgi:signal transduction histidine kinase
VLFTERSAAEAYTTYTQARINLILAVGIGAALALLLGVIVAQRITRPVASLQRTVRRVAVGDLDARSTVIGDDEISELARGFNQMAQALNQRIAEIDEKNRALSIATAEAREASRLKDEFLAVMSHELRTPLNAIIGFTGVILMESDQLTARHTHLLTRLEANSERLLALINDILDISRIEAGRLEIVPSEIDLRKMVGRLCDQLAVLAQERQLAFSYQFDDALPQKVWLDEDGLTKIVTNLISNAIKFTDQGSVRVDLRRQGENTLLIEVSDTGRGIPAHMQEIIFERFRQVDGSVTREHGGTGLGLAIVRRMCEAMGGTVRVRSVIGEGSTFTVLLPFETQAVTT